MIPWRHTWSCHVGEAPNHPWLPDCKIQHSYGVNGCHQGYFCRDSRCRISVVVSLSRAASYLFCVPGGGTRQRMVLKVDVASLQETHAPSQESIRKWFANSGFRVVSSSVSNKRCGTAVLIKDCFKVKQFIQDDAGRFVQVLVDFDEDQLSFISLYAPNRNPDQNAFFSSLSGLIDLTRPTFVCGDFNSVLVNDRDRLRRASYTGAAASRAQESGQALQSLLSYTETYPLWRTRLI